MLIYLFLLLQKFRQTTHFHAKWIEVVVKTTGAFTIFVRGYQLHIRGTTYVITMEGEGYLSQKTDLGKISLTDRSLFYMTGRSCPHPEIFPWMLTVSFVPLPIMYFLRKIRVIKLTSSLTTHLHLNYYV